jgi:hypothetical protein
VTKEEEEKGEKAEMLSKVAETRHTFQNSRSPSSSPQSDISLGDFSSKVGSQRSILILVLSEALHLSSLGVPDGGVEHYRQPLSFGVDIPDCAAFFTAAAAIVV